MTLDEKTNKIIEGNTSILSDEGLKRLMSALAELERREIVSRPDMTPTKDCLSLRVLETYSRIYSKGLEPVIKEGHISSCSYCKARLRAVSKYID